VRATVAAVFSHYRAAAAASAGAADSAWVGALRAADSAEVRVGARPELLLLRGAATASLAAHRLQTARRSEGCGPARLAAETARLAWDRVAYADHSPGRFHADLLAGVLQVQAAADSAVVAWCR
jgi:hypothetical protein